MELSQAEGNLRNHTSPFHQGDAQDWCCTTLPSEPVPLFTHSFSFSSTSPFPVSFLLHLKKEHPLRLSVSLLLHLFSLLVRAGIELHPCSVQDPWSVCGSQEYAGYVTFLYMVCDYWCHQHCTRIRSTADYHRLARVAAHVPPRSHLQCPPERRSLRKWSKHVRISLLRTPSPSDSTLLPRRALLQTSTLERGAGLCSSTATAFSTASQNCRTPLTITRCWLPVCKKPNWAWTVPSKSS